MWKHLKYLLLYKEGNIKNFYQIILFFKRNSISFKNAAVIGIAKVIEGATAP